VITQELDHAKVGAFAQQMIGSLNGAHMTLMTSVGHHTGLLDTMADMTPSTSCDLAEIEGDKLVSPRDFEPRRSD
jgi:hypothetical protein